MTQQSHHTARVVRGRTARSVRNEQLERLDYLGNRRVGSPKLTL